jgi:luciferase family oxidoreductase group 1
VSIRLSVLDQSPIREGGTARQAIAETIELARRVDALGYHRYWLAEHHNSGGLASSAPEVLITRVAAETTLMRVGSGGVMLPHYASLKVAEQFRTLEALYPGGIDLGLGRAPGSDGLTARALQQGFGVPRLDHYPRQVLELVQHLSGSIPEDHPAYGVRATPAVDGMPEVWLLGSSNESAMLAAELGLPLSFAHFINAPGAVDAVAIYRDRFKPSRWLDEPRVSVGVSAIAADTAEEAEHLAWSRLGMRFRRARGVHGVPPPEVARDFDYTAPEREFIEYQRPRSAVGDPGQVRDRLLAIAAELDTEELIVLTITYAFEARIRSYELLAEAFGLQATADAANEV